MNMVADKDLKLHLWCRHYSCWQLQCFCEDHSARVGDVRKDFRYTSLPPSSHQVTVHKLEGGHSLRSYLVRIVNERNSFCLLQKLQWQVLDSKCNCTSCLVSGQKMNTWFDPCSRLSPVASHLIMLWFEEVSKTKNWYRSGDATSEEACVYLKHIT